MSVAITAPEMMSAPVAEAPASSENLIQGSFDFDDLIMPGPEVPASPLTNEILSGDTEFTPNPTIGNDIDKFATAAETNPAINPEDQLKALLHKFETDTDNISPAELDTLAEAESDGKLNSRETTVELDFAKMQSDPATRFTEDPRYVKIRNQISEQWQANNKNTDLLSAAGQDFQFGKPDDPSYKSLSTLAEEQFRRDFPDASKVYDTKVYSEKTNDPIYQQLEAKIQQVYGRETINASRDGRKPRPREMIGADYYASFATENPTKAEAYAAQGDIEMTTAIKKVQEKHKVDVEAKPPQITQNDLQDEPHDTSVPGSKGDSESALNDNDTQSVPAEAASVNSDVEAVPAKPKEFDPYEGKTREDVQRELERHYQRIIDTGRIDKSEYNKFVKDGLSAFDKLHPEAAKQAIKKVQLENNRNILIQATLNEWRVKNPPPDKTKNPDKYEQWQSEQAKAVAQVENILALKSLGEEMTKWEKYNIEPPSNDPKYITWVKARELHKTKIQSTNTPTSSS